MSWISDFIRNPFSLTHNLICLRSGEKGPTHFFLLIFHFHLKSIYYSIKCRVIFIKCESKNIFFFVSKSTVYMYIFDANHFEFFYSVVWTTGNVLFLANLNVWRGQGLILGRGYNMIQVHYTYWKLTRYCRLNLKKIQARF